MSWISCMNAKIEGKYGPKAVFCAEDLDRNHLEKAAKCICDLDPSLKVDEVILELTLWSAECL